jgi:AcrR family transcriptional regulator
MARTVNEAAYEARRNAILDAAQRAIATRGYEQMAIADVLNELHISSGAFYHYFDSKPALLLAIVERMGEQIEQLVFPIVQDRASGALDKLQRFFKALDQWKLAHQRLVLAYMHIWFGDENAIVRHKLYLARIKRLAPMLEEIIRQGVAEGVFTAPYPDQTARMIVSLFEDVAYATVELLLSAKPSPDDLPRLQRIVVATADALERVLGAPAGCLQYATSEELASWLALASQEQEKAERLG